MDLGKSSNQVNIDIIKSNVIEHTSQEKQFLETTTSNQATPNFNHLREFEISWPRQREDIFLHLGDFVRKDQFLDMTIWAGNRKFRAHKVILAAASDYFKEVIVSHNSYQSIISFKPFAAQHMHNMLTFIYGGKCSVPMRDLKEFLHFARYLRVHGLNVDPNRIPNYQQFKLQRPTMISRPINSIQEPQLSLAERGPLDPLDITTSSNMQSQDSNIETKDSDSRFKKEENHTFSCNKCGKRIITYRGKKILTHIGKTREDAIFECTVCDKKFTSRRNLMMHNKNHELNAILNNAKKGIKLENDTQVLLTQGWNLENNITQECTIKQEKI